MYDDPTRLWPCVEAIFAGSRTQPCIHDEEVLVIEDGAIHRYDFFFKNSIFLPVNTSIPWGMFHGDIVVMRKSFMGGYIDIRPDDTRRINFAVKK